MKTQSQDRTGRLAKGSQRDSRDLWPPIGSSPGHLLAATDLAITLTTPHNRHAAVFTQLPSDQGDAFAGGHQYVPVDVSADPRQDRKGMEPPYPSEGVVAPILPIALPEFDPPIPPRSTCRKINSVNAPSSLRSPGSGNRSATNAVRRSFHQSPWSA